MTFPSVIELVGGDDRVDFRPEVGQWIFFPRKCKLKHKIESSAFLLAIIFDGVNYGHNLLMITSTIITSNLVPEKSFILFTLKRALGDLFRCVNKVQKLDWALLCRSLETFSPANIRPLNTM